MIDVHTLYLAGLISQATFALTLTLLAWSDRRTKGVVWLAAACAMQFAWTSSRAFGRARETHVAVSLSACLLVVLFYCIYMGFRWFVVRRELRTRTLPVTVGVSLTVILGTSVYWPGVALVIARVVTLGLGIAVVSMMWRTRIAALRLTARFCAVLVGSVLLIMMLRLFANQPVEQWRGDGREPRLAIYGREATVVAVTMLSFSFIALFVGETNRRLHEETRIDALTGLRNRRAMEEAAAREVAMARQNGTSLALLMMDLDRFKDLNDTWGHSLGDRALRTLGSVLQAATGARDFVARMGGEEFAVLLPGRDLDEAAAIAERLRATVGAMRVNEGSQKAVVTVSIGVSVLREGEESWSEMLCRADDALYRAKNAGRDRVMVCVVGPSPMSPERLAGQREWRRWLPKPGQML
jgi:diguanylate cyclase (GGDEF)-like protein